MLDIQEVLKNPESVKKSIQQRGVKANVDEVIALYAKRKEGILALDQKRAEANVIAKTIPGLSPTDKPAFIEKGRALNHAITQLEAQLREIEEQFHAALLTLPNYLAADTPEGKSDHENVVIKHFSEPPSFSFVPKDHLALGESLNLLDFHSGATVAGTKFYFLKNDAVMLELALQLFVMKLAIDAGYQPLITPDLAKREILIGAGFSPRGEESNVYNLEELELSLIATAEIPVAGMHANEILNADDLPLKYVAHSHCFRREAGAAGQENKGLYRVHQFSKIELFQFTKPEDAENALEDILQLEEKIYQLLEIPYRIVRICGGDLGAAAYKKYDVEAWMPGRASDQKYGEITSCSNCTDYQSRRLNIRYRDENNKKIYPYTLNGTAVAMSRTLMAIFENYQQADGSIAIPTVLQPYMGKTVIQ